MTPLKAIRAKCIDCTLGQLLEIKHCPIEECPLFLFRFGTGPKRETSAIQRAASRENLKRAILAKNPPEK